MEDILSDIDTLKTCKRALEVGVDPKDVIQVLDTTIRLKELQVDNYEQWLEEEHGISNT
tara:strand:+ start:731 stop:907 length:177 start_codon:yes stop_codon:yes gene_type:complete